MQVVSCQTCIWADTCQVAMQKDFACEQKSQRLKLDLAHPEYCCAIDVGIDWR